MCAPVNLNSARLAGHDRTHDGRPGSPGRSKFTNRGLGLVRRNGGQKAARSLGIAKQELLGFGDVGIVGNPVGQESAVGVRAAGCDPQTNIFPRRREHGHMVIPDDRGYAAGGGQVAQMAQKAKARDVGQRVCTGLAKTTDASRLSWVMTAMASAMAPESSLRCFAAVVMIPSPRGLVSTNTSPRQHPRW